MMIFRLKYYLIIAFIAINFSLFANGSFDTLKTSHFQGTRFSLVFKTATYSIMKFELLNYSNLNPIRNSGCHKCESYKKPNYLTGQFFDYQILSISYLLKGYQKFNLGITRSTDHIAQQNYNVDTLRKNVILITNIGYVLHKYVGLSPSFSLSIPNNNKGLFYTTINGGFNIDFIYKENYIHAFESLDSIYYPFQSNNFVEINTKSLDKSVSKMELSRISPVIALYLERYNTKREFSFLFGISFIFRSLYQRENAIVNIKRYKVTPIILGVSYHFK